MRNVADNVGKKVKTSKLCSLTLPGSRAIYEIIWKYCGRGRQATEGNAIRRKLLHADDYGYTHKHTHTHRICSTHFFATGKMVARTQHRVTLYVHCLSCFRFLLLRPSLSQIPESYTLQKTVSGKLCRWRFAHSVRVTPKFPYMIAVCFGKRNRCSRAGEQLPSSPND